MRTLILITTIFIAVNSIHGTSVTTSKHVCPICKTEYLFRDISSQYNSQFDLRQYIEWTYTQTFSIYCCVKCYYSTLKNDFDNIPSEKQDKVRAILKTIKFSAKYQDYTKIPATKKLEIAERIYKILGRDDEFWCNFYRILGYHYEKEMNPKMAMTARFKALLYAHVMLDDGMNKGKEKELLYIIATMNYCTGQKSPALLYLKRAERFKYVNYSMSKETSDYIDNHLTYLIADYQSFIRETQTFKSEAH